MMKVTKLVDGSYQVESRSGSLNKWIVNSACTTCNCPKFKFILKGQGDCHHITAAKKIKEIEYRPVPGEQKLQFDKTKFKTPMFIDEFIDKFGETQYRHLMSTFEIVLIDRMVRLL